MNWAVAVGLAICGALLVVNQRRRLASLLRLRGGPYPPLILPVLGLAVLLTLYLMSGFAFELTSIRYLVPMWAMLPALLAASAIGPSGR